MATSLPSVGQAVREMREDGLGLTLREFARRLGISAAYLCDIEHDRRRLSPRVAAALHKHGIYSTRYWLRLQVERDIALLTRRRHALRETLRDAMGDNVDRG